VRRREFVTSLGVLVLETAAVYAAAPTTLGGRLRRLTAPGTGDNRATYLPDGTALLFASSRDNSLGLASIAQVIGIT